MFLEPNPASTQGGRSVTANFELAVLDQREGGQEKKLVSMHKFGERPAFWGFPRLIRLDELAAADRAFLKGDRLMVRADICATSVSRGGGGAA